MVKYISKSFVILIIAITILLVGCTESKSYHYTSREVEDMFIKKEIKSLGLNDNQEGNIKGSMSGFSVGFGYGSGSISGSMKEATYYYVYVKQDNDKLLLEKFDATTTFISESQEIPHLEEKVLSLIVDKKALQVLSGNNGDEITVDGKPLNKLFLRNEYYVGNQVYTLVNMDHLLTKNKEQLLELFPELKDENKSLLISTGGNELTLYVPQGAIVTEYNADVNSVN